MYKSWLEDIKQSPGGKIHGLLELKRMGIPVPDTYVLVDIRPGDLSGLNLEEVLAEFSDAIIVRSSVSVEDGSLSSYAGFFPSKKVKNDQALVLSEIMQLYEISESMNMEEFSAGATGKKEIIVSVILQSYIRPRLTGTLFTVDPVSQRRDLLVIYMYSGENKKNAVQGEMVRLYKQVPPTEQLKDRNSFTYKQINQMHGSALLAEEQWKVPLDMEWVIDENDNLFFVQLRPVTTLQRVHWNELDDEDHGNYSIYSLGAIGEILPGIVTPLTQDIIGDGLDESFQDFARSSGVPSRLLQRRRYIKSFYYRFFLNMSALYDFPRYVALSKKTNLEYYIQGRTLPGADIPLTIPFIQGLRNLFRQVWYFSGYASGVTKLEKLIKNFFLKGGVKDEELFDEITELKDRYIRNFKYYFKVTSFTSATHYVACLILGEGRQPDAEVAGKVSFLLRNMPGGFVQYADDELGLLVEEIKRNTHFYHGFSAASYEDAWIMISKFAPAEVNTLFKKFVGRHGHRSSHEMELNEKSWIEDPHALVEIIRQALTDKKTNSEYDKKELRKKKNEIVKELPILTYLGLRFFLYLTNKGAYKREEAKSYLVKLTDRLRKAYRRLGAVLTEEGLLYENDQVFYLKHQEIASLLKTGETNYWADVAGKRKKIMSELNLLAFKDVYNGVPYPIDQEKYFEQPDLFVLKGLITSPGLVKGKVRVIRQVEELPELQKGEILVAVSSDNGFTPYFKRISGLITELGHPLSHSAIIAREFGVPAVVGIPNITHILKTGDVIILDAEKGVVERLD